VVHLAPCLVYSKVGEKSFVDIFKAPTELPEPEEPEDDEDEEDRMLMAEIDEDVEREGRMLQDKKTIEMIRELIEDELPVKTKKEVENIMKQAEENYDTDSQYNRYSR